MHRVVKQPTEEGKEEVMMPMVNAPVPAAPPQTRPQARRSQTRRTYRSAWPSPPLQAQHQVMVGVSRTNAQKQGTAQYQHAGSRVALLSIQPWCPSRRWASSVCSWLDWVSISSLCFATIIDMCSAIAAC